MEILETKGRKMNKIKREEREDLHTFSDTTQLLIPPHLTTATFVRLPILIGKVKLHKPVVVELLCHRL